MVLREMVQSTAVIPGGLLYLSVLACMQYVYITVVEETMDNFVFTARKKISGNFEGDATVAAYFKYVTFFPHISTLTSAAIGRS